MSLLSRMFLPSVLVFAALAPTAEAQISLSSPLSSGFQRTVSLEDQLINRLRATTDEQQAFVRYVVDQVEKEKLDRRLVLAIERYALNRNRILPFNYFERALRFEASRRGVDLPPVQQFVSTQFSRPTSRTR